MFRFLFLILFTLPLLARDASLTFLVADLKYNEEKGIQICEIQSGARSLFGGYDELYGKKNSVARRFCSLIQSEIWYTPHSLCDGQFIQTFKKYNQTDDAKSLRTNSRFLKKALQSPSHPESYSTYPILFFGTTDDCRALGDYPGVLKVSEQFLPYQRNKEKINHLFRHPSLSRFKPTWEAFPFHYTPELANQICSAVPSEYLVIKPLADFGGHGVLIVHKDELDSTLAFILSHSSELKNHRDPSYSTWYDYKKKTFVVEEFVPSTPLYKDGLAYDPTMRVAFILLYSQNKLTVIPFCPFWKLPLFPMNEPVSATLAHKSKWRKGGFAPLDPALEEHILKEFVELGTALFDALEEGS